MKKQWKAAEMKVKNKVGGRLEAGSGSIFATNDVRTDRFSIEVKSTEKQSFTLSRDLLLKVRDKALRAGKTPVLTVHFADGLIVWVFFDECIEIDPSGAIVIT